MPIKTTAVVTSMERSPSGIVVFIRCKPEVAIPFEEGQFIMVSSDNLLNEKGVPVKRAYSIATTQKDFETDGTIGFIVKEAHPGGMSEFLTKTLQVGDTLSVDGSYGHMVDKPGHNRYLFISAGSGLSPMLGMYNAILEKETGSVEKVALLYGERFANMLLPSVAALFRKDRNDANDANDTNNKNNTSTIDTMHSLYLSKETLGEASELERQQGHIQEGLEESISFLNKEKSNHEGLLAFICGMPQMVDEVKTKLMEMGLSKEQILSEKY